MSASQIKELLDNKAKFESMCKSAFDDMDKDKSGFIDSKELEAALARLAKATGAPVPSKKDVETSLAAFDKNKDGKMSLDEFITYTRTQYEKIVKNDP
jgi:Ca2+-binding EF-hand superfamily protein